MIENIMISWCIVNGMVYSDYYVTRGGQIIIVAYKGKKEKSYIVKNWNPFRVESMDKMYTKCGY